MSSEIVVMIPEDKVVCSFSDLINEVPDTLVSVAFGSSLLEELAECRTATVDVRRSDWGKGGWKKHATLAIAAVRTVRQARQHERMICCTASTEAFLIALLKPFLLRGTRVEMFDILIPQSKRARRWLGKSLNQIDRVNIIRRGDRQTLIQKLNVHKTEVRFVPFPSPRLDPNLKIFDGGYIYSGGAAHRDWDTLSKALDGINFPAKIRMPNPHEWPGRPTPQIDVGPISSVDDGRMLAAGARLIVLSLRDTDLPSGPLVLLDALAMGKPIVASQVNGTVDYFSVSEHHRFVKPGDAIELRQSIVGLWNALSDRNEH